MTKNIKEKIELKVQKREALGSGLGELRKQGMVPGVLYGKGLDSISVQVNEKDLGKTLKRAGESTLVYLNLDGSEYPTIIHDVVRDPVRSHILHVDFYKVRLDEKIKAMVPIEFDGESPAVKDLGGILVKNINELEVEGLPQNLPHEIKVDIAKLVNIGDTLCVKDIKLSSDIKLTANAEDIIALVQAPKTEEQLQKELEQSTVSVEDVEEIKKEKEEEPAEETTEAPVEDKKE
jgi:large subunit ribosomal protein L25